MVATLSLVSYLMCALIMDTYNVVLIVQPADPFSFPIAVARPSAAATHLRAIPTGCGARTARRADWVGECADPNWANHIPTRQIGLKSTIPDRIKSSLRHLANAPTSRRVVRRVELEIGHIVPEAYLLFNLISHCLSSKTFLPRSYPSPEVVYRQGWRIPLHQHLQQRDLGQHHPQRQASGLLYSILLARIARFVARYVPPLLVPRLAPPHRPGAYNEPSSDTVRHAQPCPIVQRVKALLGCYHSTYLNCD
jgi:hypothetical protein